MLNPTPEEVDDVCWVTRPELRGVFDDKALLFSSWFRLIMGEPDMGGGWWDDLDRTIATEAFCDYSSIHRFGPPEEHTDGAGDADPLFGANACG